MPTSSCAHVPGDDPADGRRIAEHVIGSFPGCPIPEVARLGRTLKMWRDHVLARFDTYRISNGYSSVKRPRPMVSLFDSGGRR
jgi:hypothetical protein